MSAAAVPSNDPPATKPTAATIALLTSLALVAFAANSILCRLALGAQAIDAASFALLRLGSGAALLGVLHARRRAPAPATRDLVQPAMLFLYAAAFAFAYRSLSAGTGALILFGCVQATMILAALRSGERFRASEAVGLVVALAGLGVLVAPGLAAPSPLGSALMAAAGVAWGVYSLRGRGSRDPVGDTARNFALATPLAAAIALPALRELHATPRGALLAIASGAVTSGLGYVAWYGALRGLTAIRAAAVQLAVPALAAAGGVLVLGERMSARLLLASVLILGGIGVVIAARARRARAR